MNDLMHDMKIAVITCNTPHQRYFINTINRRFSVGALFLLDADEKNLGKRIVGYKSKLRKYWKRGGRSIPGMFDAFSNAKKRNRILNQLYPNNETCTSLRQNILNGANDQINVDGPIYREYKNVNSPYFKKQMKKEDPDILLVFGGPIVSDTIIGNVNKFALNLHWGLSPYYRGGRTTLWPIYNDEPEYIGVTIHRLTAEIDGGRIITQGQPELSEGENLYSIELKLSKLGTDLVVKTLDHYVTEGELPGTRQNFSEGTLYLGKDLTAEVMEEVQRKLSTDYFAGRPNLAKKQKEIRLIKNV